MTDYALPSELTYSELSRLYPSRKLQLKRQPFNASTFTEGTMIQINIPKMDKSFLNCQTTCLSYTLNFTLTTDPTNTIANNMVADTHFVSLLSSAWAPFRRYVLKQSGGVDIDQIDNANALVHKLMDFTMNNVEKEVNVALGFNQNNGASNIGAMLFNDNLGVQQTRNISATFCIPLIGVLGATDKFIPMNTADLEINLTVDQQAEFLVTDLPTNATVTNVRISNVELIGETLQLEDSGYQQLLAMYPDGFKVKSQSFSYASGGSIAGGSSGTQDIVVPFSLSSLKQFILSCQVANAWDRKYGGTNPNLNSYQLLIGGSPYPVQPVNCLRLAEVYYNNSVGFGSFYQTGHSGSAVRTNMGRASTAGGGAGVVANAVNDYRAYTSAIPATAPLIELSNNSNKFNCCLDMEHINQQKTGIYTGVSTRGSTNTLRLNIGSALEAQAHIIHMFAGYDVQLTFDWRNGQILYSN